MYEKKIDIEFKNFIISFVYLLISCLLIVPFGIYGNAIYVVTSIVIIMINVIFKRQVNRKYINSINDYIKYDYWRDINFKNITPIEAGTLLGTEKIGINTFITILFQLEKKQIFNIEHRNSKIYVSLKNNNIDDINKLEYYEKNIVKFLFKGTYDKTEIEVNEIISMIKNDSEKKVYLDYVYRRLESEIKSKYYIRYLKHIANDGNTYFKYSIGNSFLIVNIFVGFLYTVSLITENIGCIPVAILISLLQLFLAININRAAYIKSEYIDEVIKLNGLYNYINDFSNISEKELKYYELYEEYFLYAVSMGIADKFEADLNYNNISNNIKTDVEFLFKYKEVYK